MGVDMRLVLVDMIMVADQVAIGIDIIFLYRISKSSI